MVHSMHLTSLSICWAGFHGKMDHLLSCGGTRIEEVTNEVAMVHRKLLPFYDR